MVLQLALQLAILSLAAKAVEGFSLIPPQPAGLSHEQIVDLARKRYGGRHDENDGSLPMEGRVVCVTGAAGGIGRALSGVCHGLGATIVAMDRNTTGLDELKQSLEHDDGTSSRILCLPTQHEDLASVSQSADNILRNFEHIDLLICNAGMTYREEAELGSKGMKSAHGYDLAFTVNYLSHFLLVEKLMPALSSSISSPQGRIVHLTSTYQWKVDGSELIPQPIPIAYQSERELTGTKA